MRTWIKWAVVLVSPASSKSFVTVFVNTPATRLIDHMDDPSTNMLSIWIRLTAGNLFTPYV